MQILEMIEKANYTISAPIINGRRVTIYTFDDLGEMACFFNVDESEIEDNYDKFHDEFFHKSGFFESFERNDLIKEELEQKYTNLDFQNCLAELEEENHDKDGAFEYMTGLAELESSYLVDRFKENIPGYHFYTTQGYSGYIVWAALL